MSVQIDILRRSGPDTEPWWQSFRYEPLEETETVATALTRLCADPDLRDLAGRPAAPIRWEHSCLQKKCGACAMVICGKPRLACDAALSEYKGTIRLEPLRKFPVVADLMVDRSVMFENLRNLTVWLETQAPPTQRQTGTAYEASRCLQCGCCLEVCPNFDPEGSFPGAAGAVPMSRILEETGQDPEKRYRNYIYEGCGKSLSCKNICPAGIDVEHLMTNSSGVSLWRWLRRKRRKESFP